MRRVTAKKAYLGYDAIDWIDGWVMDVKEPPDAATIEAIENADDPVKPKTATKLYRGFNQGTHPSVSLVVSPS